MQSAASATAAASADIRIPFWKCDDCKVHWQASACGCSTCGKTGFRLSINFSEIAGFIYAVSCIKDLESEENAFDEFEDSLNIHADAFDPYCRPLIQAAWFAIGGDNPPTHPKITLALQALERIYEYAPDTKKFVYPKEHAYRYTPEEHASNDHRKNAQLTRTILEMLERCETLGHI
jgi:hypothetical protein